MAWVRIDDGFPEHRKVVAVGPLGMALQVAGICYCNRNLTDGFIPWAAARTLLTWEFLGEQGEKGAKRYTIAVTCGMQGDDVTAEFVIGLLLDAGIWEEVEGGYRIHDYDEYQPTKAEVLALQEERREAGRRGGLASVEAKRQAKLKQTSSKCSSKTEAKFNPNPNPNTNTDLNTDDDDHAPILQIQQKYAELTGRLTPSPNDIEAMQQALARADPDTILAAMTRGVQSYKPRFERDRIKSFRYFLPIVDQVLAEKKARESSGQALGSAGKDYAAGYGEFFAGTENV